MMRLCPHCGTRHLETGAAYERCQVKRQVVSAQKMLRRKRPRILNESADTLVEFINVNTKDRGEYDWFPDATEEDVLEAKKRDLIRRLQNPPKSRPVRYRDVKKDE